MLEERRFRLIALAQGDHLEGGGGGGGGSASGGVTSQMQVREEGFDLSTALFNAGVSFAK